MKWLHICVLIMASVLLSGCIFNSHTPSVKVVSITPDKTVYHSGDTMRLNIVLETSQDIQNVTICVTGLKNSVKQILLNKSMTIDLVKGTNNETFKYKMPYCSPCIGLNPGVYSINVAVFHDDKIVAKGTVDIKLKQ